MDIAHVIDQYGYIKVVAYGEPGDRFETAGRKVAGYVRSLKLGPVARLTSGAGFKGPDRFEFWATYAVKR